VNEASTSANAVTTDIGRWAMVPLWVMRRLTAIPNGGTGLVIFVALHHWVGRDGECWPSVKAIGALTGLSADSVRRGLRALESVGAVTVIPRYAADGDRSSNAYRLRYVNPESTPTSSQEREDPLPADSRGEVEPVIEEEEKHSLAHVAVSESAPTPSVALARTEEPDGFEDFWRVYPRKIGKAAAAKRWARMTDQERAAAGEAIRLHAQRWGRLRTESQFIPHAVTWLNQRRWEDDMTAEHSMDAKAVPSAVRSAAALYERARAEEAVARPMLALPTYQEDDDDEAF
jgi:hypothetical protein